MAYFAPKGSVCVQGVSLTIAELSPKEGWFEIALIPTTLDKTTLGGLRVGDGVNIECDAIAKTVVHYLRHFGSR
jgi:riboflavin synthase